MRNNRKHDTGGTPGLCVKYTATVLNTQNSKNSNEFINVVEQNETNKVTPSVVSERRKWNSRKITYTIFSRIKRVRGSSSFERRTITRSSAR